MMEHTAVGEDQAMSGEWADAGLGLLSRRYFDLALFLETSVVLGGLWAFEP